jgi:cytochrome c oxidase subunit 2
VTAPSDNVSDKGSGALSDTLSGKVQGLQSSLQPGGPAAETTAEMTWVLVVGAGVVFGIVLLCIAAALRHRPRAAAADPGRAARWWIVGAGVVFPVLVLVPLLIYATARSDALTPPRLATGAEDLVITVQARLWWWRVTYRDPSLAHEVITANQINLPTGRAVTLALVSDDVIHSFWVPALAGKVDMVPGKVHHLRLQADRAGVYRGQCAEFCGEQHARMAIHVVAQAPDDFARWLQAQAAPAAAPSAPDAVRGLAVFTERRCSACHSVLGLGLGPEATLGPDLTHVASRLHLGAGTLPFSRASLADWIADPQHAKPGARMPSYALDPASMQALVSFLEQLR